ncbi:EVE domain-containing protein [Christensenellaceae bacterium NSJ-63]|uniref:EVE domain-containing protein n=1 Tax=Guopingia tenuis TaxID=2763656 RepID=A0A926HWX0_9FIRM|nr:EVE domain-containing protein [Guopingia tenuis]MBC8538788.1 EVE domain-containing protein [Guopingia tenuis]
MAYYIGLFSPDTYDAFGKSARNISGFRNRQKGTAASVKIGDKLICYMTKLSRWVGILEVTSEFFVDNTPIFVPAKDPFEVRFQVKPLCWLEPENAIPIGESKIWEHLSFTKNLAPGSSGWTGMVRASLRELKDADGRYLEKVLMEQKEILKRYALTEQDEKKLRLSVVKTQDSQVAVTIPENESSVGTGRQQKAEQRESIRIQALLAMIGERMRFDIWLPKADRQRVLEIWKPAEQSLLEQLPMNYNEATLSTIENIDVLWIHRRSIKRAFEVEHTTSIYSGILRMADLMALQPDLNIKAHIVAPAERKAKVLMEISRPVFAFLENGPLAESCTYLSYDAVKELSEENRLQYMSDRVIEEYEEYAGEADI